MIAHISRPTIARVPPTSARVAAAAKSGKTSSPTSVIAPLSPADHVASKIARTQQLKLQFRSIRDAVSQKLLQSHETLRVPTSFSEVAFTRVRNAGHGITAPSEEKVADSAYGTMVGKVHVPGESGAKVRILVRRSGLSQLHNSLLHGHAGK